MTSPAISSNEALTVLCFSRSYLSHLLPALAKKGESLQFLHVVQTEAERRNVEAAGGTVVCVVQRVVREGLKRSDVAPWSEPADFRAVTGFNWSPIEADRHLPTFSHQRGRQIAAIIYREFERLFTTHDIAGVLSEPVALFPTHVLQYLVKKKGGASLLWANAFFPGYLFFTNGIDLSTPHRGAPGEPSPAALREVASAYVHKVAADAAGPLYHHKFARKKASPFGYFRQRAGREALIYAPGVATIALQALRLGRSWAAYALFPWAFDYMSAGARHEHLFYLRNLLGSRRRYDRPPTEYGEKNVFFPLQFEPEASLLYSAPDVQDQFWLIQSIARSLPDGAVLWVKEHPNQFGVLASRRWMRMRKAHGNIRFVHGRENGRELMKACGLAVAITSQAGIDAMILGRRTIVLGNVFYRGMTGSIPVRGTAEMASALNDRGNYGVREHKEAIIEELVDLGRTCYPGDPQPSSDLYDDQNMMNLYSAVLAETKAANRAHRIELVS